MYLYIYVSLNLYICMLWHVMYVCCTDANAVWMRGLCEDGLQGQSAPTKVTEHRDADEDATGRVLPAVRDGRRRLLF